MIFGIFCDLSATDPTFVSSSFIPDEEKIYFFFSEVGREYDFIDKFIVSRVAQICMVRVKTTGRSRLRQQQVAVCCVLAWYLLLLLLCVRVMLEVSGRCSDAGPRLPKLSCCASLRMSCRTTWSRTSTPSHQQRELLQTTHSFMASSPPSGQSAKGPWSIQ